MCSTALQLLPLNSTASCIFHTDVELQGAAGLVRTLVPMGMGREEVCPPDVTFREPSPYTTDVPLLPGMLRGTPAP